MFHVRLNEMSGSQGGHEREFAGHDGGADDSSQTLSIGSRVCRVSTSDSKDLKHGALRRKDGATTDRTNLDGWHGDSDQEVFALIDPKTNSQHPVFKT